MNAQEIRKQIRELRATMKQLGIRKTSMMNRTDDQTYRLNARLFELETRLKRCA